MRRLLGILCAISAISVVGGEATARADQLALTDWQATTPFDGPRASHAAVLANNRIYILGGLYASGNSFTLYNDVRTPVTGFYTQRPDKSWSDNWLASPLAMGQKTGMTFAKNANNAACVRVYRIVTSGDFAGSTDRVHDFCKNLGLHITANGPASTPD